MQSNWRFYGNLTEPGTSPKTGVLFVRAVTTSLMLSAFGRRLARFPLRRAHRMTFGWVAGRVKGEIDAGQGSAPDLTFEGEEAESPRVPDIFGPQFCS